MPRPRSFRSRVRPVASMDTMTLARGLTKVLYRSSSCDTTILDDLTADTVTRLGTQFISISDWEVDLMLLGSDLAYMCLNDIKANIGQISLRSQLSFQQRLNEWIAAVLEKVEMAAFRDSDGNKLDNFGKATLMAPVGCAGFLDHVPHVRWLVDFIHIVSSTYRSSDGPFLYMDCEGRSLGRDGTISILQPLIAPLKAVFLLDIFTLGFSARYNPGLCGKTLKDLLKSSTRPISTCWFDLRAGFNALFYIYDIQLNAEVATDLQVYNSAYWHEYLNDPDRLTRVWNMDDTIQYWVSGNLSDAHDAEFYYIKSYGRALVMDKKFECFEHRPLLLKLIKYCVQDVALLPDMWESMMQGFKRLPDPEIALLNAREVSTWRGKGAMSDDFTSGPHNSAGPWGGIKDSGLPTTLWRSEASIPGKREKARLLSGRH